MCTLSVSNVIYHKFSHGAAFYTLNGKNVNVVLELFIFCLGGGVAGMHKQHAYLFSSKTKIRETGGLTNAAVAYYLVVFI